VQLHKKDESVIINPDLTNRVSWDYDFYAWFFINGIPGGTDAYFWNIDDLHKEFMNYEMENNNNTLKYKDEIIKSMEIGYRWNFRRSAGQPGIIVLAYGLLSASLCELTDGLIYTDDGAWDYSLFPTTAEEFCMWYFRPELSRKHDDKKWAEECIASLHNELKI
jgi:hypothetical protein